MLYKEIQNYIEEVKPLIESIPDERKQILQKISGYIADKKAKGERAQLIYICTHNSRRSHFGQIWGQALAAHYHFNHVDTFSGGTEATAFNPNAIKAIKNAGFQVSETVDGVNPQNPFYQVDFGEEQKVLAFSKKYNDPPNPSAGFCAIMTCNDADENCPVVFGAELRVATPYLDPKQFDNTPQQDEKYAERCRQIASEILYLYSQV